MRISATVHAPWQAAFGRLVRTLREKGFQTRRTFDLQLARQSMRNSQATPCPHHGTAPCDCQYLVLQISGPDRVPSAVVIHGHDMTTTVSFLKGTGEEARQDMASVMYEALEHLQTVGEAKGRAGQEHGGAKAHHQGEKAYE